MAFPNSKSRAGVLVAARPTLIMLGVAGFLIGFMIFTSTHQRERIRAALRQQQHQNSAGHGSLAEQQQPQQQQQQQRKDAVDPCGEESIMQNTELWGDVVVPGKDASSGKGMQADSAAQCCRACEKQRGCNRWVWCHNPATCGKQCWLKRTGNEHDKGDMHKGASILWTSGFVPKDFDIDPAMLPPINTSISKLLIKTKYGTIRITLKPDWSPGSVSYVRRLAAMPELCTAQCQFYRAEPGFLLQGSLRAFIPPNNELKEGPKFMERGEIGWAGGGAGPDWFIYLGDKPATHFGRTHTVWGVVDNDTLSVVEKMVKLPAHAPEPGGMHMLDDHIDITTGAE